VAGQVALSLVLLAVSATLVQGFRDQLAQGPGFRIDHLFLTSLNPQLAHYTQDQAQRFYQNLLDRTRQAPGVKSATLVSNVPMNGIDSLGMLPENWQLPRGLQTIDTYCARVSDGYFETMRIPILQGRAIAATDREDAPLVAVVNEQMAAHYWKGDALGKRFHLGSATGPLFEIVGIAKTSKYMWTAEAPLDFFYLPFRQLPRAGLTLVAESADRDGTALAPVLRETVRSLDPDMPVFDARGMREFYTQRAIKTSDIVVQLVAGMGLLGMVLAGVGLYGLVAYSVSRRTREIGLRMALGAHPRAVAWMVLRQGLWLGLAGIAAGLLGAFYICPLITSRLTFSAFTRVNLLTVVAIPLGLLLITMLASWAPAARASRVDPLTSLRDE
jgi:predicted permease